MKLIFHQTDFQRELLQSYTSADQLHQQLQEKDFMLKQLQQDLEEQTKLNVKLQDNFQRMFNPVELLIHTRILSFHIMGKIGPVNLDEILLSLLSACQTCKMRRTH